MDIIDTNKYNSYKKDRIFKKSYFPDTLLFEKYKCLNNNERKRIFAELDEYISKTNSVLLTYDGSPDCFNSNSNFDIRFKDSLKIAAKAGSYIYFTYLQICSFYTICYILKQTDVKFDAQNKIVATKNNDLTPISVCNQIIEGTIKEVNRYLNSASKILMDDSRNFNNCKLNINFVNFNVYYCNFLNSSLHIPLINNFDGRNLKKNNKTYSTKFINNVLDTFFKFKTNETITKKLFCSLFEAILNGYAFEFNDIPDLINLSIAKFYNCGIETNDKKMKTIAKYLNISVI